MCYCLYNALGIVGSSFDQREFNHEVLSLGNAPLSILERHINSWIASKTDDVDTAASLTSCHALIAAFVLIVLFNANAM